MEHTETRFPLKGYGCTREDQIAEMALNLEEVLIHALLGLCVFVGLLLAGGGGGGGASVCVCV